MNDSIAQDVKSIKKGIQLIVAIMLVQLIVVSLYIILVAVPLINKMWNECMPAEKSCSVCDIQFNILYRVRHLQQHYAKKEWVFACRECLLKVKRNNIHYKYGGTWKSRI